MAHADGRLTDAELAERVERADSAWSLRELSDLIADVSLPNAASQVVGPNLAMRPTASMPPIVAQLDAARRGAQMVLARSLVGWLALALLFNIIWLFSGGPGSYYWPIWPMLGTAFPLIGLVMARFGPDPLTPSRRVEPPADLR